MQKYSCNTGKSMKTLTANPRAKPSKNLGTRQSENPPSRFQTRYRYSSQRNEGVNISCSQNGHPFRGLVLQRPWRLRHGCSLSSKVTVTVTLGVYAQLQLRSTGRILDHFRAVIGRTRPLEIDAHLMDMIPCPVFRNWRFRTQRGLLFPELFLLG